MDLGVSYRYVPVHHDVRQDFGVLLRAALQKFPVIAALGPIYAEDPARELLEPFFRSATVSGYPLHMPEEDLAPPGIVQRAIDLRRYVVNLECGKDLDVEDLIRWTRAGLVLEVARRRGVKIRTYGTFHPVWKLRGTVTGRFGVEPIRLGSLTGTGPIKFFNPHSMDEETRKRVIPSASERHIAVLDFRAMDLCSMISIVPGLKDQYIPPGTEPHPDLHHVTAIIMGGMNPPPELRELLKTELFVHAYGGHSVFSDEFDHMIPQLKWLRAMPHGEGARLVQSASARAFRAALSAVLPDLVGDNLLPMLTVHDELVLDSSEVGLDLLDGVAKGMAEGASQTLGVPYRVKVRTGYTYEEAKNG